MPKWVGLRLDFETASDCLLGIQERETATLKCDGRVLRGLGAPHNLQQSLQTGWGLVKEVECRNFVRVELAFSNSLSVVLVHSIRQKVLPHPAGSSVKLGLDKLGKPE